MLSEHEIFKRFLHIRIVCYKLNHKLYLDPVLAQHLEKKTHF